MDSPSVWTFDWAVAPVGLLQREQSGWVLRGRSNSTPELDWVVAHDVFHHAPGDRGTYAEEVSTFGAEAWMEQALPDDRLFYQLQDSWLSVMALTLENGTRGVAGLAFPAMARSVVDTARTHPRANFFRQVYAAALNETREAFGPFAEPAVWDRLAAPPMADRAVALAVNGFERAARQWPDVDAARRWFSDVEASAGPGREGEVLTVVRDAAGAVSVARQLGHSAAPSLAKPRLR